MTCESTPATATSCSNTRIAGVRVPTVGPYSSRPETSAAIDRISQRLSPRSPRPLTLHSPRANKPVLPPAESSPSPTSRIRSTCHLHTESVCKPSVGEHDRYASGIQACRATLEFYSSASVKLGTIGHASAIDSEAPSSSEEVTPKPTKQHETELLTKNKHVNLKVDTKPTRQSLEVHHSSSTLYQIIGVEPKAALGRITTAFRSLARKWHPDRRTDIDDDSTFKAITEAYAILSDKERRAFYDRTGFKCEEDLMANRAAGSPPSAQHRLPDGFRGPVHSPVHSPFSPAADLFVSPTGWMGCRPHWGMRGPQPGFIYAHC